MNQIDHCVFETTLGPCGIAWHRPAPPSDNARIALFRLPEGSNVQMQAHIGKCSSGLSPSEPPKAVARVIDRVQRHLNGDPQDFSDVDLDLDHVAPFAREVYTAARAIPAGQVKTYGELARAIGQPGAARAVGQALGRNPLALLVPCHRILAAGGKPGGFSAHGGLTTKAQMLALEGYRPGGMRSLFGP